MSSIDSSSTRAMVVGIPEMRRASPRGLALRQEQILAWSTSPPGRPAPCARLWECTDILPAHEVDNGSHDLKPRRSMLASPHIHHLCQLYASEERFLDNLATYIGTGLRQRESVIV